VYKLNELYLKQININNNSSFNLEQMFNFLALIISLYVMKFESEKVGTILTQTEVVVLFKSSEDGRQRNGFCKKSHLDFVALSAIN
jgi:hypothetical protein